MALAAALMGCQGEGSSNQAEPITPDVELTAQEIQNGVLTPEVLWKFGRIGSTSVSPDAKTVLFTVTRYSMDANKGVTNIYTIQIGRASCRERV